MPRNPSVTSRPVRAPFSSSSAFVPTVVPWEKKEMSFAATPCASSSFTPFSTAWNGSFGVEGTFVIVISPVSSLKKTKSEKVPPVSTVTRNFAMWDWRNIISHRVQRSFPVLTPRCTARTLHESYAHRRYRRCHRQGRQNIAHREAAGALERPVGPGERQDRAGGRAGGGGRARGDGGGRAR